jgi:hypothetical protein
MDCGTMTMLVTTTSRMTKMRMRIRNSMIGIGTLLSYQ